MKTIRISDETHRKLTATLGTLVAETGKMQTYQSAIETLLNKSVILPPELLKEIEKFIAKNKEHGYSTKEEFIRQATCLFLKWESENYEYMEIPKAKIDKLNEALKSLNTPYYNANQFINTKIDENLNQYEKWLKEKEKQKSRENEQSTLKRHTQRNANPAKRNRKRTTTHEFPKQADRRKF